MNEIVQNIVKARNERHITQEQMANALGVSRATYIGIEGGRRDLSTGELTRVAHFLNVPVMELMSRPGNEAKFRQMYFYILGHFRHGIPKTKLAKLLYLADFKCFYDTLEPMSGVGYVHRQYGPLADSFLALTDELYDSGKIALTNLSRGALMIESRSYQPDFNLLTETDRAILDQVCAAWRDRSTTEIVNYTHEQKPWSSSRDGEYIPYELIIQEDPEHVYQPVA